MRPQISHYYGRSVERLSVPKGNADDEWTIELSGGVILTNLDDQDPPEDLASPVALLSSREVEEGLELLFGISTPGGIRQEQHVIFTHGGFLITDPAQHVKKFDPYAPVEEANDLPPDPSPDRVADGPTTPPETEGEEEEQ